MLRHDIQLLADQGVITTPTLAWPLPWGTIARDLRAMEPDGVLTSEARAALSRLQARAQRETRSGVLLPNLMVSVAEEPRMVRTFEDTPRESGEVRAGLGWTGDRFAVNVQVAAVSDPDDNKDIRLDGSYAGVALGNWMLSANAMDRWWGPGWEGSLILSNNARPVPAFSLERNYADPLDIKWLRWVGPWTAQVIYGQMEDDRFVPNARLFGMRVGFRPVPTLEVGLSRAAQWCGTGRPCDFSTFVDMLTGLKDNTEDPNARDDEPGNQLAGYDLRWAPTVLGRQIAIYAQLIGEDEAGGLPSQFLGLVGVETWGLLRRFSTSFRVHAEYADTRCGGVSDAMPSLRCAYNHSLYQTGYRYRGRVVGHAVESDGLMFSVGGLFVPESGRSWNALARRIVVNRSDDARNTISQAQQTIMNLELSHSREIYLGQIDVGLGYDRIENDRTGDRDDEIRAFLHWHWDL